MTDFESGPAAGAASAQSHESQVADRFLQHHFDDHAQQSSAAKLGMWIFLVTEILLFSGLFCVYAIFRSTHPEVFRYGAQFLDVGWGSINTIVLLLSSLTMALAVRAAQLSDKRGLVLYLIVTLLCAFDFLGVKWIEYRHKFHENLVGGWAFYEGKGPGATAPVTVDLDKGRTLFSATCAACHGADGQGAAIKNKSLLTSMFVAERDDAALVEYVKVGRTIDDPQNTTGIAMLPRGGNPALKDRDLVHIVGYVRFLQERAGTKRPPVVVSAAAPAVQAAQGAKAAVPANAHLFFSIYFLVTGLHGFHVLVGMVVIGWLLARALRGSFNRKYFTPVEMGGLYWHLVDVIWIFVFPLLYLIH